MTENSGKERHGNGRNPRIAQITEHNGNASHVTQKTRTGTYNHRWHRSSGVSSGVYSGASSCLYLRNLRNLRIPAVAALFPPGRP
jgi:hypothetical protein